MIAIILDFEKGKVYQTNYNPQKDGDLEDYLSTKNEFSLTNCQYMSVDADEITIEKI